MAEGDETAQRLRRTRVSHRACLLAELAQERSEAADGAAAAPPADAPLSPPPPPGDVAAEDARAFGWKRDYGLGVSKAEGERRRRKAMDDARAAAAAAKDGPEPLSPLPAAPSPDWVQLGSEVEFSDASGAWCSGELLSLLDAEGAAASAGGAAVTAVVKSRLAVSAGPYSAGKLLLLRTRVPVADLRPRPPPPPPCPVHARARRADRVAR